MGRNYFDDVLDIAIKHAGREMLCDIALEAPPVAEEAQFSNEFEKKMARIIGGEARRNRTRRAAKIATRVAAVLLIVLFVSTAVVFSSEALRTKVFNMFAEIGEDFVDIGSEVAPGDIPEGMTVPEYIPEGFRLTKAKKTGKMSFKSNFEDSLGNTILIQQMSATASIAIDNDGKAYETQISGVKVIAADNDDNSVAAFIYKEYAYIITGMGETKLSQLLKVAKSIIDQHEK